MKKEEKRLCWSCDGYVSFDLEKCPYCAVELSKPAVDETIPASPYASVVNEYAVSKEEWDAAGEPVEKETQPTSKNELTALLLLIPGASLAIFALLLLFCSSNGSLTLQWKDDFAYFYLIGAIPLIILGWRSLK